MRGRRARRLLHRRPLALRRAAIDDQWLPGAGQFEREAAGVGLARERRARRLACIHHQHGLARLDALVAGPGRVLERRGPRVVIGERCRHRVRLGRAHAIEQRQRAVAVSEQAQHRHHAIDGIEQHRRRLEAARRIGLSQGQQVVQQVDEHLRVAADVAAIGQDLAAEFVDEPARPALLRLAETFRAQAERGERDDDEQPVLGRRRGEIGTLQHRPMAADAFHELAVEGAVRARQNQRRLRQPREKTPRGDGRAPAERAVRPAPQADPVGDQRAAVNAGQRRIGGAQMPQPAEAVERRQPGVVRRDDLEGRAPMGVDCAAGEGEPA